MTIVQSGSVNTNALLVPDLLVQIVPPSWTILNGVPTNILGIVGYASWGPVNSPTTASAYADSAQQFGAMTNRKSDLMTGVAAATLQGAANLRLVRVTDGTDAAASGIIDQAQIASATVQGAGTGYHVGDTITLAGGGVLTVVTLTSTAPAPIATVSVSTPGSYATPPSNPVAQASTSGSGTGATFNLVFTAGLTLTAKYTGIVGNTLIAVLSAGTNSTSGVPTFKISIALPNQLVEVFDNIGGSGNTLYTNIAAAINNGQSGLRLPSNYVIASAGSATGAPSPQTVAFSGGADGATTINSTFLIGQDTIPRKGMYALRNTGTSVAFLMDGDDTTQWTLQAAFSLSEGIYMIGTGPSGDTISNALSTKATAGIDCYGMKLMFGDWIYINDNVNGVVRVISAPAFIGGLLANLSPQNSTLNKQLFGIIGTQKSYNNQVYSAADLQQLVQAGYDVITNPVPGGSYYGARFGHNSSSNVVIHGDNYTRMTNYIASSINAGMGMFIGQLQSKLVRLQAKTTLDSFFANMYSQDMIGNAQGTTPWNVVLDDTNNPSSRVVIGYMQANVKVQYLSVIEFFIINVEGGQSVQIKRQSTAPQ